MEKLCGPHPGGRRSAGLQPRFDAIYRTARKRPEGRELRCRHGNLAARTSSCPIFGGCAKSSGAFAVSAAATLPDRCAFRPDSSVKTSKMPNEPGPMRIANHAVVPCSSSTIGSPSRRNSSTAASLPGFASSRTKRPTVTVSVVLILSFRSVLNDLISINKCAVREPGCHWG